MSAINYSELDYKRKDGLYVYPQWAVAIGWGMAGLSAIFIPLMAIYPFFKYGFTMEVSKIRIQYNCNYTYYSYFQIRSIKLSETFYFL